jgi:Type IV secretion-system coupling protein DNA-binding domain
LRHSARTQAIVLDLLNSFWIDLPLSYALTVGGLVSGYRHGGVPSEGRLRQALRAGVPVVLGVAIAWACIIDLAETGIDPRPFAALHVLLGLIFFVSASALVGAILARLKPSKGVERGTVVLEELEEGSPGSSSQAVGALTLASRPIPLMDETKHFKMIGTTGTGKSTAIRELLTGALHRGDRAVIADPYGGYTQGFYDPGRGDVILNPFDPRSSRWDLFSEIILPHDADQLARSFIPDHGGDDRHWRGYARTFVTAILRQLHRLEGPTLAMFYNLLVTDDDEELRDLLEGTPAAPFIGKEGGKFLESVRSIAIQHLTAIEHLGGQTEGDAFSVRKWIREGRGVLFLPYHANEIASLRNTISTWMRLAIFETMSGQEGDQRIWFIVDELDALGAIDGLKDALTRLRKFGGRCILGFQSIGQVGGTYGDADAQSIVENCGNTLILRCSASEYGGTAEFASRLIGKREVVRQQRSTSQSTGDLFKKTHTVSDHIFIEDAVMASEIEQLADLSGFLKLVSQPHWQRVTLARS